MDEINNNDTIDDQQAPLPSEPTGHPLYQQVENFISQGNWQAVQVPLAELQSLYPDDAYLQRLGEAAASRSALLGPEPTAATPSQPAPTRSRGRRVIITVGIILVSVLCLTAGAVVTSQVVIPFIEGQRQAARINQLRQDGETALNSGDYDRAVDAYNELLEILPNDPAALSGLERARELRVTISLYSEAIGYMEAYQWERALSVLQQIDAEEPGYRDVTERMNYIRLQQDLTKRFNEAEAAFNQGDYDEAIQKYENLQSSDSSFRRDVVIDHLFLSYLQSGLARQEAAGSNSQELQTALNILDKALVLRPNDSQTRGEVQLLRLYLSGEEDFEAGNWAQAVSNFTPVYEARSDFADDSVSQLLYDAYLAWGDNLFSEENYEQALVRYEEASQIARVDTSKAEEQRDLVEELLAPPTPTPEPTPIGAEETPAIIPVIVTSAPTPRPVPTARPRPMPYILSSMSVRNNCSGFGYIHGIVSNVYGLPQGGVIVHAFNLTKGIGPFEALPTSGDGIYQIIVNGDQVEGLWTVQVLGTNGQPASQAWGQRLGGECLNGAQELKVDWQASN